MSALKDLSDKDTAITSSDPNYDNAVTLGVGGVLVTFTNALTTYQMKPTDNIVRVVSGTGEDATGIIYLPSLAESAGKFYYITAPTGASGNDVSVYAEGATDLLDLDADNDAVLLFSTGIAWLDVATDTIA